MDFNILLLRLFITIILVENIAIELIAFVGPADQIVTEAMTLQLQNGSHYVQH